MIIIDGRESAISIANYTNLEEVFTHLAAEKELADRIITDVFVNNEAFSELYPHQSEDINISAVQQIEIRSVSVEEMALEVVRELPKVVSLMSSGGRQVASLLRQAEIGEALEVLQDVIAVSRDFLTTIQVLRGRFTPEDDDALDSLSDVIGDLLGEIADIMVNEDWLLVADLFEFEYIPVCEGWREIINNLLGEIEAQQAN